MSACIYVVDAQHTYFMNVDDILYTRMIAQCAKYFNVITKLPSPLVKRRAQKIAILHSEHNIHSENRKLTANDMS